MKQPSEKSNLLEQFAKSKIESQNNKKSFGKLSESVKSRFPHPSNSRPPAHRGGRNGQGKPS